GQAGKAPAPKEKTPAPPPPKADDAATKTFQSALERLDPKKTGYMRMDIRQEMDMHGLTFVTEGHSIFGPDYHVRAELTTKLGDTSLGDSRIICDGKTLWTLGSAGNSKPSVTKTDFKRI